MVEKKSEWDDIIKKKEILDALKLSLMSSEEEVVSDDEQLFVVKPLLWRSEEFTKCMEDLVQKCERT